jgi:beta-lactamase class A
MRRALGLLVMVCGMFSFSIGYLWADVHAVGPKTAVVTADTGADTPAPPSPLPTSTPAAARAPTSFDALARALAALGAGPGSEVGISLVELGGDSPSSWEQGGDQQMEAASTYKLAALIDEGQRIAAGTADPNGKVCFQSADWEAGWFEDYTSGTCYTRSELARRAGIYSDNTAGHMLVRDVGGAAALDAYSAGLGTENSAFFVGNQTTADDLARLLAAEGGGLAGGTGAQQWLYPYLTKSQFEDGIPAGVPGSAQVVHKTGQVDSVTADAALVSGGPHGSYALAVMIGDQGGDAGWQLIAKVSAAVWSFEAAR